MSQPLFDTYRKHFRPFSIPKEAADEEFELELPISSNWDSAPNKLLIIVGHVAREDLRARKLFGEGETSTQVLENTITYARRTAKKYDKTFDPSTFAYAAINFSFFKTYSKSTEYQTSSNILFRKRIERYVKKYQPTHILILSDQAARILIEDQISNTRQRSFNVFDLTLAGVPVKVSTSIDFCRTFDSKVDVDNDKEVETSVGIASLLGFVSQCMTSMYLGYNPFAFATKNIKPNPILITTIPQFKEFFAELWKQKVIAYDAEWESVDWGIKDARFLTLQFAWESHTGYVLPLYHPESPFDSKELAFIEKRMRKFFMRKVSYEDGYELIIQNAQVDLTMVRELLKVPFMYWPVWDTILAESGIDENVKYLMQFRKNKVNSLDTLSAQYGNAFYLDGTTFGKDDRGNFKNEKLEGDPLRYCVQDAQILLGIRRAQMYRAKHTNFGKDGTESYLPAYRRFVLNQFSNNIYAVSHMEQRGVWIDVELMQNTMLQGSDFRNELDRHVEDFYKYPSVIKANKILLREGNKAAQSMFGKVDRLFKVSSKDHLKLLFFGVLGLEPVSHTKTGDVSTDDVFQDAYKETVPEVATFQEFTKLEKIQSTYLKGWFKRIMANPDSRQDHCIRPRYGFFEVITGRSNSSNPSLQNVPARHSSAKYIKRLFAARRGRLVIKMDFSAHEVRQAAVVSNDTVLANTFWIGRNLRKDYIKNPDPKLRARIELEGDVHKVNYGIIFKIDLDKISKTMRDSVKAIIFGLLYGKSVRTLSVDLSEGSINPAKKLFKSLLAKFKGLKATDPDAEETQATYVELKKARANYEGLEAKSREEWLAETQVVFDALLNKFQRLKKWLAWAVESGQKLMYVYSPFGRRRNLYAYLTGIDALCAAMDRRSMNSPIQGMGADIGHTTNYLYHLHLYETLLELGYIDEDCPVLPCGIETMVHDSIRQEVEFHLVVISACILQWVATVGVSKYYTDVFGVDINICPEIDMEIGSSDAILHKWDWDISGKGEFSLQNIVRMSLEDQHKSGKCDDVDAAYNAVFNLPKKVTSYLKENYPIVGDFEKPEKSVPYYQRKNFMEKE